MCRVVLRSSCAPPALTLTSRRRFDAKQLAMTKAVEAGALWSSKLAVKAGHLDAVCPRCGAPRPDSLSGTVAVGFTGADAAGTDIRTTAGTTGTDDAHGRNGTAFIFSQQK